MDDPALDASQHVRALLGLSRINFVSASAGILWKPLAALARSRPDRTLRVLDVATGGGDVPIGLWKRARKLGLSLSLDGCDLSETALNHARSQAYRAGASIRFFQLDAVHDDIPSDYDAIACSLFLHHLSDDDAVEYLRKSSAAARCVLVSDLRRNVPGLALAHLAPRLLMCGPVVRTDAPLSVHAAFTVAEAHSLAGKAGLRGASISRHWPCRFLLHWHRDE